MPKKGLPDRWLDYSNYGKCIPGTKFIAFKVPLKEELCQCLPSAEKWTPDMLLRDVPRLGLIIDLTFTYRYYDPQVFSRSGVQYLKITCKGQQLPDAKVVKLFFDEVDRYLEQHRHEDRLIGVHCTHGLNRTGYLVCRYMIDRMEFTSTHAIEVFNRARGHTMEREEYIQALLGNPSGLSERSAGYFESPHAFPHHRQSDFARPDFKRSKDYYEHDSMLHSRPDHFKHRDYHDRASNIHNPDHLAKRFERDVRMSDHRQHHHNNVEPSNLSFNSKQNAWFAQSFPPNNAHSSLSFEPKSDTWFVANTSRNVSPYFHGAHGGSLPSRHGEEVHRAGFQQFDFVGDLGRSRSRGRYGSQRSSLGYSSHNVDNPYRRHSSVGDISSQSWGGNLDGGLQGDREGYSRNAPKGRLEGGPLVRSGSGYRRRYRPFRCGP